MRQAQCTMETLPSVMKKQMKNRSLEAKDLAKRLEVTPQSVNNWLRGCPINSINLRKLCKELNIKVIQMLTTKEAILVNEHRNEQLLMNLEMSSEDKEPEKEAPANDIGTWLFFYPSTSGGVYRAKGMTHDYVLVEQKFENRMDDIPFVMMVFEKEEKA